MDGAAPTLRIARPSDIDAVGRVMRASAEAIFPAYYDERTAASAIRFVAAPDPQLLEDGTYFVLEAGGEAVACGGWSRRGRPYMGSPEGEGDDRILDPATEAAHVRAMFVDPAWTRRGLGRQIIVACEEAARREGYRRLDLVATMPGVPLYEACGFTATAAVEPIVLVDGVALDCLAMTKAIGEEPG